MAYSNCNTQRTSKYLREYLTITLRRVVAHSVKWLATGRTVGIRSSAEEDIFLFSAVLSRRLSWSVTSIQCRVT